MAALWSLRPTAVDACVNLQAQRPLVSRFRNNHEFHSCFFGDEFWKTWGLLFENKTCCLTNVLLDHFRLVGVWWLEKVITKSSPLRGWIAAVDCSGLNLLIVCIYIYYNYDCIYMFWSCTHILHLADIFSFSTLHIKCGFMDIHIFQPGGLLFN